MVVFSSERPLPASKINEAAQIGGVRQVRKAIDLLNAQYERERRAFRIVEIAGGYQYQTLPEYGEILARLRKSRTDSRLTQAAMETLAIVAYRQPVLRADVEAIRGVACGEVLRGLMEKNLIRIAGRADEIGRPILYGTTRRFLEVFGLGSIEDLPNAEQLRMPIAQPTPADAPGGEGDDQAEGETTPGPPPADESADADTPQAKPTPEAPAPQAEDLEEEELDDEDEFDEDDDEDEDDEDDD